MAYQNGTTHYNLPQTVGTDKRDWSDTNKAFADVDAALYNAAESSTNNKTTIDKLVLDVNQNTQDIDTNKTNIATNTANIGTNTGDIATLKGDVQTMQTDLHNEIVDVRNDAEDMITAYNEPNATSAHKYAVGDYFIYNDILYKATAAIEVGNTIVPNTNCTATNVTTELINIKIPTETNIYTYTSIDVKSNEQVLLTNINNGNIIKVDVRNDIYSGSKGRDWLFGTSQYNDAIYLRTTSNNERGIVSTECVYSFSSHTASWVYTSLTVESTTATNVTGQYETDNTIPKLNVWSLNPITFK